MEKHYHCRREDLKYRIKRTPLFPKSKELSYMNWLFEKLKKQVDPRKYSKVPDWDTLSKNHGYGRMNKEKRITMTAEICEKSKTQPGVAQYDTTIKRKILGCYSLKEPKVSIIECDAYAKFNIPACNKYNTFKGMAQVISEEMAKSPPRERPSVSSEPAFRKNNIPGPATYKVAESMERSSALRKSIKVIMSKAKLRTAIGKSFDLTLQLISSRRRSLFQVWASTKLRSKCSCLAHRQWICARDASCDKESFMLIAFRGENPCSSRGRDT